MAFHSVDISRETTVKVLPDVAGLDKCFDYYVPTELKSSLRVGAIVRVSLNNRKVRGFVLSIDQSSSLPPEKLSELLPVEKFLSVGPSGEVIELCQFGAYLYCGRLRALLTSAKPPRQIPDYRSGSFSEVDPGKTDFSEAGFTPLAQNSQAIEYVTLRKALALPATFLQISPFAVRSEITASLLALLKGEKAKYCDNSESTKDQPDDRQFFSQAANLDPSLAYFQNLKPAGSLLVLTALRKDARRLSAYLRKHHWSVAEFPEEWAKAASGEADAVVGTRQAILATVDKIGAIVVFDAHSEAYQEERTPTWKATRLALQRAKRLGVPCIFISSVPSVSLLSDVEHLVMASGQRDKRWPYVQVIDRRMEDPRSGLYSPLLASLVSSRLKEDSRPVVFIYNRKGHSRLLACDHCGELVRCENCGGACETVSIDRGNLPTSSRHFEPFQNVDHLVCRLCGESRPVVCLVCKSSGMKTLKPGITKVAGELSALLGEEVTEVTGDDVFEINGKQILVGTEAVLNRVSRASVVIFLDIDQDILRPKYLAAEKAFAQMAAAARLLAPALSEREARDPKRRLVIQTRIPEHPVIRAISQGDPFLLFESERDIRKKLRLPPYSAIALLSGDKAESAVENLRLQGDNLELAELDKGRFLIRAENEISLAKALGDSGLPARNVKIIVDPADV